MKNIVVPIDFSESATQLIEKVISFAKEIGGRICLLHVASTDIGFVVGDMGFQYFPEVEHTEIQAESRQLHELQQKIIADGVDCEHLLMQGVPGDTILEYARQKNAAYIAIGSHGHSNLYDVFVGSLTKEITRRSTLPVVVFPVQ